MSEYHREAGIIGLTTGKELEKKNLKVPLESPCFFAESTYTKKQLPNGKMQYRLNKIELRDPWSKDIEKEQKKFIRDAAKQHMAIVKEV